MTADAIKALRKAARKSKPFSTLTAKEKDALLEAVCKILGLVD